MKKCVVVVEDEPEVLTLLCDLLEMDGYSPVGVSNPDLLGQVVATVQPDLFLVDLVLPGTDGVSVATKLRTAGYEKTPMIGMSASRLMTRFAGHTGVFEEAIEKPFDIENLLECVGRHARRNASPARK